MNSLYVHTLKKLIIYHVILINQIFFKSLILFYLNTESDSLMVEVSWKKKWVARKIRKKSPTISKTKFLFHLSIAFATNNSFLNSYLFIDCLIVTLYSGLVTCLIHNTHYCDLCQFYPLSYIYKWNHVKMVIFEIPYPPLSSRHAKSEFFFFHVSFRPYVFPLAWLIDEWPLNLRQVAV